MVLNLKLKNQNLKILQKAFNSLNLNKKIKKLKQKVKILKRFLAYQNKIIINSKKKFVFLL